MELLYSTPLRSKETAIIHTNSMQLDRVFPTCCLLSSQSKPENTALIKFSNSNLKTAPNTISSHLSDLLSDAAVTMKFDQSHPKLECECKGCYHLTKSERAHLKSLE